VCGVKETKSHHVRQRTWSTMNKLALYLTFLFAILFGIMLVLLSWLFFQQSVSYDPISHISEIIRRRVSSETVLHIPVYENEEGIIFLKTHKTASSTLTSLLWRNMCEQGKRNCFLPHFNNPGKTWDFSLDRDWDLLKRTSHSCLTCQNTSSLSLSMWLHHAHYHKALFSLVHNTSRIISIVRRPALRFRSAWRWYGHSQRLGISLEAFAKRESGGNVCRHSAATNTFGQIWCFLSNLILHTFFNDTTFHYRTGLDATTEEMVGVGGFKHLLDRKRQEIFQELVSDILQGKVILLVADRFPESLYLLSKIMGWHSRADVLYSELKSSRKSVLPLKRNSVNGNKESPFSTYAALTDETAEQLDFIQPYDSALWQLANRLLDEALAAYQDDNRNKGINEIRDAYEVMKSVCDSVGSGRNKGKSHVCYCLTRDNHEAVVNRWLLKNKFATSKGYSEQEVHAYLSRNATIEKYCGSPVIPQELKERKYEVFT
jgi:hypothetical protein